MARQEQVSEGRTRGRVRLFGWSVPAALLLIPLIGTISTGRPSWEPGDFAFAAILLAGAGVAVELATRRLIDLWYRSGLGVALGGALTLIWVSAGVGIIGSDGDPANLLYALVVLTGVAGALLVGFRPQGMYWVMLIVGAVQGLIAVFAILAKLGMPASGPLELVALNGFFVVVWLSSAWLFRRSHLEGTAS